MFSQLEAMRTRRAGPAVSEPVSRCPSPSRYKRAPSWAYAGFPCKQPVSGSRREAKRAAPPPHARLKGSRRPVPEGHTKWHAVLRAIWCDPLSCHLV